MCCRSCKDMPLLYCVRIYSLLCIVIGIFFAAWAVWASHGSIVKIRSLNRRGVFNLVYIILTFFAALSYVLAGILMLIGTRMRTTVPFVCGKALSVMFPLVSFMFILPLVIHFLFVTKLSDYMKERWPEPEKD